MFLILLILARGGVGGSYNTLHTIPYIIYNTHYILYNIKYILHVIPYIIPYVRWGLPEGGTFTRLSAICGKNLYCNSCALAGFDSHRGHICIIFPMFVISLLGISWTYLLAISLMLGKGGQKIREMQEQSGAYIKVWMTKLVCIYKQPPWKCGRSQTFCQLYLIIAAQFTLDPLCSFQLLSLTRDQFFEVQLN